MIEVELLGSDGWKSAGRYSPERARDLAELLRLSGAVVRLEDEAPIRGRIRWSYEPSSGTWVGGVDGIELFAIVAQERNSTLYPALPGYRTPKTCASSPVAQDTAERIMDHFIMRVGVRGVAPRTSSSERTAELDPTALACLLNPDADAGGPPESEERKA